MAQVHFGMDKELAEKMAAKYDVKLEAAATSWLEALSGEQRGVDQPFADWLRSGQVLCKVVNAIRPGIVKKVSQSEAPFKQMENISFFLYAARELGVPENATFSTPDLYEERSMNAVLNCLLTLGGAVQVSCPDFEGPVLGVALNAESRDCQQEPKALVTDQCGGLAASMERIKGRERPDYCIRHVKGPSQASQRVFKAAEAEEEEDCQPTLSRSLGHHRLDSLREEQANLERIRQIPRPGGTASLAKAEKLSAVALAASDRPAAVDMEEALSSCQPGLARTFGTDRLNGSLEQQVATWVFQITGMHQQNLPFATWLKDGKVLCALANSIQPGCITSVNEGTAPFQQMENITFFMNVARGLGVPESAMFSTPDLYEEKNIPSVVNCLYTLGCAIQVTCPDFKGPRLGVAMTTESKAKRRVNTMVVDQTSGLSSAMEVQRPSGR